MPDPKDLAMGDNVDARTNAMLTADEIEGQRQLLAATRRTLAHLLLQAAAQGGLLLAPLATAICPRPMSGNVNSYPIAALPPGSRMPFRHNPLFVGRAEELQRLAGALLFGSSATAAIAATGLGGIGKSNLATEFVHRYGRFFPGGVF
jgi:hypothetical protein